METQGWRKVTTTTFLSVGPSSAITLDICSLTSIIRIKCDGPRGRAFFAHSCRSSEDYQRRKREEERRRERERQREFRSYNAHDNHSEDNTDNNSYNDHYNDNYDENDYEDDLQGYSHSSAQDIEEERARIVSQLMSLSLQCMGAVRLLVLQEERERGARDCVHIDSSSSSAHRHTRGATESLLQRQLFAQAASTLLDTILIGREILAEDPVKELVEAFPAPAESANSGNNHHYSEKHASIDQFNRRSHKHNNDALSSSVSPSLPSQWFMLHWAVLQDFLTPPRGSVTSSEGRAERFLTTLSHKTEDPAVLGEEHFREEVSLVSENTLSLVKATLKYFPESITEVDRFGQTYITYVLRTRSLALLEFFIRIHPQGVLQIDGRGRFAFHYAAMYSETMEPLLLIREKMNRSLDDLTRNCVDDFDNLPIHFAASGISSEEVLEELLFSFPDSVKAVNRDGQLPLHLAAQHCTNVNKVRMIFRAYPNAISTPDKNGWLPLQHAAYATRSLDVVRFLYECYPDAIKKVNHAGRIPLHYNAVKCHSPKIMKFLVDTYPQSARIFDVNQRLALHNLIARCEHWTPARLKCLRILLEAFPQGASLPDKERRTPYDLARRDGHGPLVLRLLLLADPAQDPLVLGELTYFASKAKFKDTAEEKMVEHK